MVRQPHPAKTMHMLWLAGASCEGCTMSMLGASTPSLEDLLLGRVPDVPPLVLIHPTLALESGTRYLAQLEQAAAGLLAPFILILEGSILDESLAGLGSFSRLGRQDEQNQSIASWVTRLAPQAETVVAIGSCATWGGVPAAAGSVTGAMGLEAYLGREFCSRARLPIINVPGCAPSGDAFVDTLIYLLLHLQGLVPLQLDEDRRPAWLYNQQTQLAPPRVSGASSLQQQILPMVDCPVPAHGWIKRIGGCARVGGCCIGCTAPDFTDRYLALARPYQSP